MKRVGCASYLIFFLFLVSSCSYSDSKETYRVSGVLDGDTVIIDHPKVKRLRYLGINAPETLTSYSPGDPYYFESTALNKKLVFGKEVTLEFDEEKYDSYGRLLAYVFVDGKLVNEELVREGLARAFFIGPNRKYEQRVYKAQSYAQEKRKGIWSNQAGNTKISRNREFLIKPENIKDFIHERVVVRGKITGEKKNNSKVLVLGLENDLDIVIFKDSIENFKFFSIDPATYYTGKPVEVIGKVTMYRGSPQIVISHPTVIRELN